tara:strand:- start:62252 stop:62461 length:210 start_codon:yes stop_codon:yes gene_type:complete
VSLTLQRLGIAGLRARAAQPTPRYSGESDGADGDGSLPAGGLADSRAAVGPLSLLGIELCDFGRRVTSP